MLTVCDKRTNVVKWRLPAVARRILVRHGGVLKSTLTIMALRCRNDQPHPVHRTQW
jgi:hypothetical protein